MGGRQWGSMQSHCSSQCHKAIIWGLFFYSHLSYIVILGMICGINRLPHWWSILQKAQSLLVRDYPFKGWFSKQWWEYINNQQNDARKCPKGQIKHIRSIKSIHSGQCFRRYTVAYRSTTAHLQRCRDLLLRHNSLHRTNVTNTCSVWRLKDLAYTLWVKWTCLGSKNG